jgi:F0F1-type ATP synthase assembly protein I
LAGQDLKGRTMTFTASRILCLIAVIVFALATFGVSFPVVAIVPLGLTFLAASFLVP